MIFSSYEFVFLFLPIVLIVFFSLSRFKSVLYQHLFLVSASLFFYGYFNTSYLAIIISSILVNYIIAKLMLRVESAEVKNERIKRFLLVLGIVFNIGMLGYFKYSNFFIENMNALFQADFVLKNILLPLGISFFTFQQFSFLISVYKGKEKVESFIDYCLFVTFFPQLVAGPIVLYSEMMPQFTDKKRRYINYDNMAKGFYIFIIGLFKKIVIADTVALFVNNGFAMTNLSFSVAWVTALSYTLQIYFDFSGYSDMAIGLGKMFNIDIPINFMSPYKSESITEFWRRWHITLGRALGTYVYIPLGGNRNGKVRTCINLFITFIVSGLWHGASWTFVLWGALHGAFIVFERIFNSTLKRIPKLIRIGCTFLAVNFLWVLFRAESFSNAINIYKGMLNFGNIGLNSISKLTLDGIVDLPTMIAIAYIMLIIVLLYFVVFCFQNTIEKSKRLILNKKTSAFVIMLFIMSVIHMSRLSPFIYFNF